MTEYLVTKAIDLDLIPARDDLIIIVSDPALPVGPSKRSKKVTLGSIRPVTIPWDIVATPLVATIPGIKSGDFLKVQNADTGVEVGEVTVYTGDTLIVLTLTPAITMTLIPKQVARSLDVLDLVASANPVVVKPNTIIYTDVSAGEITLDVLAGSVNDEYIDIIPVGGAYSINNLIITSSAPIAGVVDNVVVDVDDIVLQLRWKDAVTGWIVITR